MTILTIQLSVKFRVLFTDLYKYSGHWTVPLPVIIPTNGLPLLSINERGVVLVVTASAGG